MDTSVNLVVYEVKQPRFGSYVLNMTVLKSFTEKILVKHDVSISYLKMCMVNKL
jgi:hypothetical protein